MGSEQQALPPGPLSQREFREWLDQCLPSDPGHYELLNGRIVVTPPAGWPHGRIGARVVALLANHSSAQRLGEVLDSSTGFDLPSGDTLEPDAAFVSRDRWAAAPRPVFGQFLRVVPDLVVEILSRSTRVRDLTEKKDVYARNGVDEYWVIDPRDGTVTIFVRSADAFDVGTTLDAGAISSRVLPHLDATVEAILGS